MSASREFLCKRPSIFNTKKAARYIINSGKKQPKHKSCQNLYWKKKSQHLHYYSNTFNKPRETVAKGTDM